MVWEKTELGKELEDRLAAEGSLMVDDDGEGPGEPRKIKLAEYQQREKQRGTRRRLMDRAGLSSSQAADMSVQNLRDLVRDNRASSEAERKEAARLARMAPRMRNEFELGRMDDDWRNAVAAQQFGMRGPTPLGVQAAEGANAMELAQQMVRGLEGDSRIAMQQELAQQTLWAEKRKEAAAARDQARQYGDPAKTRRDVRAALQASGTPPEMIREILREFDELDEEEAAAAPRAPAPAVPSSQMPPPGPAPMPRSRPF